MSDLLSITVSFKLTANNYISPIGSISLLSNLLPHNINQNILLNNSKLPFTDIFFC